MFAAIYIRVSTEEQAEHGYSIDVQKERLIAFCKSQGWDDYKLYIDDGYTGTNTNRPALKRLIRHVEAKKIHTVVVFKLDRLSRKQKDVLSLIEDVFEKNNVAFASSSEKFDTSTPFGKAMIGILAVFAQLERDMIVERTTSGRRQKIKKGIWGGGRVPFGYRWNKKAEVLEIVPDEARIVKKIFELYLEGHSRLSIAEWAANKTNARTIDHSTIRDMLKRPVYAGDLSSAGTVYENSHEPIIDRDMWEAAQKEAKKRAEGASPLGEYLLTGLLKCGVCGKNIVHVIRKTTKNNRDYIYHLYACKEQHVRKKDRTNHCTLGYTPRKNVEDYVIGQIKNFDVFSNEILNVARENDDSTQNNKSVETIIKDQINKTEMELENLYDAIQNGDIKASAVSARIKNLEETKEQLENNLDDLFLENDSNKVDRKLFTDTITKISQAWDYFTEDEQKSAVKRLIKSITLNKDSDPVIEWLLR